MFGKVVLLWFMLLSSIALADDIPRPKELEPAVQFWIKVYTRVSTQQGYLHDASNLAVIYETISFPPGSSLSQQDRILKNAQWQYQQALTHLGQGKRTGLSSLETRVLQAWPTNTTSKDFRLAAANIRFQRGQSDRFREGLVRSGQWKPHIRATLSKYGLPMELDALPHVESSFNPKAYSKVAAAGMWQFMPSTAKQYMQVDGIVDQRMDPYISTDAAAKLLKRNYQVTGSWPLALTAYNFGTGGMVRASKALGTTDISKIVRQYRGPKFGFASRNFYASFLASLEVDRNASNYFGGIQIATPLAYDTTVTRDYVSAMGLAKTSGIGIDLLKEHNPSLLAAVWTGEKHIPKGFQLKLPKSPHLPSLDASLAAIPASYRFNQQVPDVTHRIARGETLSTIAQRYHTKVSTLMALNGIREAHKIRAGQSLRLPGFTNATVAEIRPVTRNAPALANTVSYSGDYIVKKGDSLWKISKKLGISQQQLSSLNNLNNSAMIKPGQSLKTSVNATPNRQISYVIQPGDSLWKIARHFNLSENELIAWNNLKNQHQIKIGQVLKLAAAY